MLIKSQPRKRILKMLLYIVPCIRFKEHRTILLRRKSPQQYVCCEATPIVIFWGLGYRKKESKKKIVPIVVNNRF